MNPYATSATAAYADAARTTASPERLLCMVYDRLLLDLERAAENLERGQSAHTHLMHAQDIVHELLVSLDHEVWDGAGKLASIYVYLHTKLIEANVRRDLTVVVECRALVAPLRDAWHAAAERSVAPAVVDLAGPRQPMAAMTA